MLLLLPLTAGARRPGAAPSPRGDVIAEVRRAGQADSLWVARKKVWPSVKDAPPARIVTALAWSRRSDAVAFVTERGGSRELVVVYLPGRSAPQTLSWPIPRQIQGRHVMWVGAGKVGVGPSEVVPQMIASFELR